MRGLRLCAISVVAAVLTLGCGAEGGDGITSPDPVHEAGPELPPEELGLPPNPMARTHPDESQIAVPPPPITPKYWPCTDCHEPEDTNRTPRAMRRDHRRIVLAHDEENRWCLDCHDADDRDKLRLASGRKIGFDVSYLLCGQCHGTKLRDWRAGVHGKRTGMWTGERKYLLCVHCHNPHSPRFAPIEPKPAPYRPEDIQ